MTSVLDFLQMFKRGKRYYNLNKAQKKELTELIEKITQESTIDPYIPLALLARCRYKRNKRKDHSWKCDLGCEFLETCKDKLER